MPIYEYQCEECQHELEALQKMSDDPLKKCPSCGDEALTKKISAVAFRLKGSGWYETDFKSGNKKNLASGDKSPEGAKSSGGESSSDSGKKSSSKESSSKKSDSSKNTASSNK